MIAYLEKPGVTADVPDDISEKDLGDINNNFHSYFPPPTLQGKPFEPLPAPGTTGEPQATSIAGQPVQPNAEKPENQQWIPNFYKAVGPALALTGIPGLATPQELTTPEAEAFTGKAAGEASFGLTKPFLDPILAEQYKEHPMFATAGQFAGGVGSLFEAGAALRWAGFAGVAERVGQKAVEAGLDSGSRYITPAIMQGATFGTRTFVAETVKAFQDGKVDLCQFGKDVLRDTAFGAGIGAVEGIPAASAAIPSAAGLGFISKKMEGGDNRESLLNAAIWGTFEAVGSFGRTSAIRLKAMDSLADSVGEYVQGRNPEASFGTEGAKVVGRAFVDTEIKKAGFESAEDLAKSGPENTLQVIENINQKVRQGIVPPEATKSESDLLKLPAPPEEDVPDGTLRKQNIQSENEILQMRKAEEEGGRGMPSLPREVSSGLEEIKSIKPGSAAANELPILYSRLRETGQDQETALRTLREYFESGSPSGLQQALGSDMAVPSLSPTAPQAAKPSLIQRGVDFVKGLFGGQAEQPAPSAGVVAPAPGTPAPVQKAEAPSLPKEGPSGGYRSTAFPLPPDSYGASIAEHPDFIQLSKDANAVVTKYALDRGQEATPEFATKLFRELHDALKEIGDTPADKRLDKIQELNQRYPDLEREFTTLRDKLYSDTTDGYFEIYNAQTVKSLRPQVALDVEKADQAEAKQKALKFDEQGIPIRRPGSVVSTVESPEGETVKITHQMVMNEAKDLLDSAKERYGGTDPIVEFVRDHGGIKGFKGMEQEEFKQVPIHVRGQVAADEMAQMLYDRNLLEEPSADLLRNYLASVRVKGAPPALANFYQEAQHNLEGQFSGQEPPRQMGAAEPPSKFGQPEDNPNIFSKFMDQLLLKHAQENAAMEILDNLSMEGTSPISVATKFADETYDRLPDFVQKRFETMVKNMTGFKPGSVLAIGPNDEKIIAKDWKDIFKSLDLPNSADYLEGTERGTVALMDEANRRFINNPVKSKQQELNLSPYEETPSEIQKEQGKAPADQPTVRGGFKALRTPHLEVEFKKNGFLMFPNRKINSPADLAYGFKFLHNEQQENFFLAAIKDGQISAIEHMGVGTIDQVAAYPFETISLIDKQNADSFFIVHNHPSGHVMPSDEDKKLTRAMRSSMENNGIEFKGHVIIDDTKFGFIDPEGNTSQIAHHAEGAEKTSEVPILKKYFEWLKPKEKSFGPLVGSPHAVFEIFKGIQKGKDEAVAYLTNTQNELINAIVVPKSQFNAGTLQRLAAAYRASGIISVESGLSDSDTKKVMRGLYASGIRYEDDIQLSDKNMMGYESRLSRGVFEPPATYGPEGEQDWLRRQSKEMFPEEKENVADRYNRLRDLAIQRGMSPSEASRYAKDNLRNKEVSTRDEKLEQQEFKAYGGVESFGKGRKGEGELFAKEPKSPYGDKEISRELKDSAGEIRDIVAPTHTAPLAAQITREQLGIMARSYDKAEASLQSASELFGKQPNEENVDFIDRMEHGVKQPTKPLETIAKQLRVLLDEKRTEIRDLGTGKLDKFIEDYFPHIWDQGEKQVSSAVSKAAKRPLEGSKSFLKKRTIEFTKEGIEMGLTPVSYNPVDLVLLKMREMDKYLMAHRTLKAYKENGLAKFVKLGQDRPEGWIKIDDRISTVMHMTDEGLVTTGHIYAQPDAARIINNYLSPGLQKNATYRAFRYAGNALNQFQLGFSAFHLGFTSMDAMVSKVALGLNQLFAGHPVKAIQSALSAPIAPISNILRGNKLFEAWRGNGRTPMDEVMAQAMASAGGRARMDQFYATKAHEQMAKLFKAGKPIRGILSLPMALTEASTKPILEYIVPRQKLGIFADIMKMEMENHPDMTHEEMRGIAQKAWDSVDNRMGQLVYDNLFWNRTFKDLLMASVRSVGWNLGTIRELAGGAKDLAQMPIDLARGKKTDLTYRGAYVMALPILAGILGAIYQYVRTGKGPQELKDYYFPRTGGTDANGEPNRVALPTYMKDLYHYGVDPVKTVENKLNPLLAIMAQMFNNKDYYGAKIKNEDDPVTKQALSEVTFVLKQLEPFGFRNMEKQLQTGNRHLADVVGPWIGITPAPYDVNQTKAERMAHDIAASHQEIGGRTQEQVDRSRLANDLTNLYKLGDPKAQEDIFQAYKKGKISRQQMQNIVLNANLTPLQKMVKPFTVDETQRIYDAANDEEKAQIEPMLDKKIANHERAYVAQ